MTVALQAAMLSPPIQGVPARLCLLSIPYTGFCAKNGNS